MSRIRIEALDRLKIGEKMTAMYRLGGLCGSFFLFLGMVLGWQSPIPAVAENAPFQIGALLDLTGVCADVGNLSRKGIELAIEEINQGGGILGRQVQLVIEDGRETNSINAVTAYKRLTLNSNLHFIIGPSCTPAGIAVAPLVAKNSNVLMISPSIGLRQFNEAGDNIFKLWPYDEDGPKLLAQYAWDKGWKTASIFSSQQTWEEAQGNFFAAAFEKLGGKILEKVEPVPGEPDLQSSALRLVRSKPDFVLLTNYTQYENASKELKKQGFKGPSLSALMTEEKVGLSGGALEGNVTFGYAPSLPDFVDRFSKKFGKKPWGISSDTAYDAVHLIANAINSAKAEDPKIIGGKLLELKDFPGASGTLSFDQEGGVLRKPILYVARGSKLEPLEEIRLK